MARPPRKPGYRPPRRTSSYRPRVAGRGRASTPVEGTVEPVDGTADSVEGTAKPVDGTADSADGTTDLAEGTADPADGTAKPADGTADPVEGTAEPVEGTAEPVEGTAEPADGTEESADPTGSPTPDTRAPGAKTRPVARVSTIKPNAAASKTSPAAGTAPTSVRSPRRGMTPSSLLRMSRTTLGVLGVITGVLVVAAVILALHPGASIGSNKAFIDQAATSELVSQAQTKVCTANSATGVKFDEWSGKARAGLTGEALEQFNKQVAPLKQVMEQAKATTDCQIDAIGVRDLTGSGDGSRAVIVVNMVLSGTQNGVPTQSLTPRYQVNMEKHGDAWLIAKVADI
ncbi:hypothetical protein LK459_14995 [Gordonia otitidis]|uniref:hypothetical protein n=1 Tax=Gordonia otitidis TaxID=249058 RepID=UPI001D14C8B4|nr:hypothetical protein [Gordonia otitidis]UEA57904.1 hypothetical protein LK459_14995 [Gordonia otitidis]